MQLQQIALTQLQVGHAGENADTTDTQLNNVYTALPADQRASLAVLAPNVIMLSGMSQLNQQSQFSQNYTVAAQQWNAFEEFAEPNAGVFNDTNFQVTIMFFPCAAAFPHCAVVDLQRAQYTYVTLGFNAERARCEFDALQADAYTELPNLLAGDIDGGVCSQNPNFTPRTYISVVTRLSRDLVRRETVPIAADTVRFDADAQGNAILVGVSATGHAVTQSVQLGEDIREDEYIGTAMAAAAAGEMVTVSFPTPEQPRNSLDATPGGRIWADGSAAEPSEARRPGARMLGYAASRNTIIGRAQ